MMSVSTGETLEKARQFILLNARLLERQLFAFLFEGGKREPALLTLRAYQNEDGGFGNALEPDKRDPHSQPVDIEIAFKSLDWLDAFDDPMVTRACDYLMTITTPEGGVPFALPTVNAYPRAPWWTVDANPPASLNPTASLAGLLLKHGIKHPWLERASAFCWQAIPATETREFHDIIPILTFLQYNPDRRRAEPELQRLAARVAEPGVVALDPQAEGYVHKPLEWASTPDSYLRNNFSDETISQHLAALAARQQADGGWPLSWDTISPAVEMEWRGRVTLEALMTLKAYERL
ncbi:MAG TPA: hypothetical protein VH186_34865 [Chloroflexia bacterium]|nr:hypothetical protein [Chloroflexia bacterium]